MEDAMKPRLINEERAAQLIGMSHSWLRQRRYAGEGPPVYWLGSTPRYDPDELVAWAKSLTSDDDE